MEKELYAVCSAVCNICTHKWVAVLEVKSKDENIELPENLECPHCGHKNSDYEMLDPNE